MSIEDTAVATQYLTFTLDSEEFALDISKVREVLDYTTITKVPRMPDFLRGVINLRGNVVPVVDLRMKLGMKPTERTVSTCIVITEIDMGGDTVHIGTLTDSVQEVLDLDDSQIQPPPRFGSKVDIDFIRGMGKRDDRFLIILDIDKVLTSEEVQAVNMAERSAAGDERAADAA
jgi:purine-binding chemotaxis protein CheW